MNTTVVSLRVTDEELAQLVTAQRPGETRAATAKRLLLAGLTHPPPSLPVPAAPQVCGRCAHPETAHWTRGCLAGCLCSAQRFRRVS